MLDVGELVADPVGRCALRDDALGGRPHQKDRLREEVRANAGQLRDFRVPAGVITEPGLRQNIDVALQYLESWLRGQGCVAIYNLIATRGRAI